MQKGTIKLATLVLALVGAAGCLLSAAQAKPRGKAQETVFAEKGHRGRGRGQDPNIKQKTELNDPNQKAAPPSNKRSAAAQEKPQG